MTVDTTTGEIVESIGADEARRLTTEAQNEFRSSRDHFDRAWSLIEEAVQGGGHFDLGYRSPGEYLTAEFDGALAGLDVAARKLAVRAMTSWGLSTRAIAPVVGVNNATVHRDIAPVANATPQTPEPAHGGEAVVGSGQTSGESEAGAPAPEQASSGEAVPSFPPPPAPPVVHGIDGKTYSRPEPKPEPTPEEVAEQDRRESVLRDRDRALSFIRGWSVGTRLIKGEHPHRDEILAALEEPYRDELARIEKEYLA